MSGILALALPALLLLVALMMFARRGEEVRMPGPRSVGEREDDGIDWDELEQAEREVRDLEHDGHGGPPGQAKGDDWGPGVPRPPAA